MRAPGDGDLATQVAALRVARLSPPWLALLVASIGALVGLFLFALLSSWLADPAPGHALALLGRRRSGPGEPRSGPR